MKKNILDNFVIKSVSVIIPMFNSEKTIFACLNSIINQTWLQAVLEIIIINDGSTDGSVNIVQDFVEANKKVDIKLINQNNNGVSSARNRGLKEAKGIFIALLDSDDEWFPHKLETQLIIFITNKNVDFLSCNYNRETLWIGLKKIVDLYNVKIEDLLIKQISATPTVIFKREIIKEIGYFDETMSYAEDENYFHKICLKGHYYHIPKLLVKSIENKPEFGYSGLSSNLKKMQVGTLFNLELLYKKHEIKYFKYLFFKFYYELKYIRRVIYTKIRKFQGTFE